MHVSPVMHGRPAVTVVSWNLRPTEGHPLTATPARLRSVSYGGGVQSTALLVLAAQRRIDYPLFLLANVGDDSEHPATLEYVRDVAAPYAEKHDIELVVLDRQRRDGTTETLWGRLMKEESRSLPIPVRMSNGAPGTRSCTSDFKIKVVAKELKRRGAHGGKRCRAHESADYRSDLGAWSDGQRIVGCWPGNIRCRAGVEKSKTAHDCDRGPRDGTTRDGEVCGDCKPSNRATVGIGISVDEIQRANARRVEPHENMAYPLISIGDDTGLRLNRLDCERLIRDAGLPVPPKSSCFFCPFHKPEAWSDLARERPDLFEKSVQLEDTLNERRRRLGKDEVYLTRFGVPLREAIDTDQPLLPLLDDGSCDSGWCFV